MSEILGNCPGLNVYGTHIPRDKQQEVSLLMKIPQNTTSICHPLHYFCSGGIGSKAREYKSLDLKASPDQISGDLIFFSDFYQFSILM